VHIHHHTLHRCRGIVASLSGSVAAVIFRHNHTAAIRIEENFGGVKPHAVGGIGRSRNAIAVYLPRLHARHAHVPVVVRTVSRGIEVHHARRPGVVFPVKQE
jgi:hypothetical protein